MSKKFDNYWKSYEPMIKALVDLFNPFMEVAIHDLNKGQLVAIYHNISKRKIGETSPLHELKVNTADFPDYFSSYYKRNWDGRQLKCTSVTVRDEKGKPAVLICFNVDVSFAQDAHRLLEAFLKTKAEAGNPVEIYGTNFEEQAVLLIQQYLEDNNLSLKHINNKQKQELVQSLYQKGIFNFKNAPPFIGQYLSISRATVYNYMKPTGDDQ